MDRRNGIPGDSAEQRPGGTTEADKRPAAAPPTPNTTDTMTELLDLPTIAEEPAVVEPAAQTTIADPAKVDLQAVALAHFGDWRGDVATARRELSTLALDLTIPARIADAKALRQRLIKAPVAEVRAVSKALKSRLTAVSKAVGAEEDAAVSAYTEAEKLITPQIEAAEARIEAERVERARIEAERIAALHAQVDASLSGWLDRCREPGMTAERIAKGIVMFKMLTVPVGLDEVSDYWNTQATITLGRMEAMQAECQRQEELARIAAEREEQRRQAEQLAKERAELERQAAALRAEQERIEQERQAAQMVAKATALKRLPDERVAQIMRDLAQPLTLTIPEEFTEGRDSQQVLKAEPATADATDRAVPVNTSPGGGPMGAGQPAAAGPAAGEQEPAATVEQPMLTLGQINTRLDPIRITGEGLCALGFQPSGRQRAAVLYLESEWTAIKSAIVNHINSLKD